MFAKKLQSVVRVGHSQSYKGDGVGRDECQGEIYKKVVRLPTM